MTFPLRTSRWTRILTSSRGPFEAEVTDEAVNVRMGWVGHAEIPIGHITRISTHRWPWFAGLGVRITKGMVAFVPAAGEGVVLEMDTPLVVHTPVAWETTRVLVGVADPAAFAEAVAARRAAG